ncbi:siderophore-interacting protein [Pseudonocardia ailaonensis]|uniref:Siderophore-interacting protein n=1 Tax=Pseudonocardia ailaonensis TaxID=367279 RepID=A0ABN2MN77_9PSEU
MTLLEVTAADRLSPSLVRIRLRGAVESLGVPDEACVLEFPEPGSREPVEGSGRWYSVRRVDAEGLTVDIVTHPGGTGGEWAAVARVGDRLRRTEHANSWYRRPEEAGWQVLAGDVTALPAIGRIVEETAGRLRTIVHLEVPDPADAQDLAGAEVTWHHTPDLGAGSRIGEIVGAVALPEGPGYVYVAGEAAATREARRALREAGLPRGTYGVIGYWRAQQETWVEKLDASGVDMVAIHQRAVAEGRDEEEVRALYDQGLAEAGL